MWTAGGFFEVQSRKSEGTVIDRALMNSSVRHCVAKYLKSLNDS